MFVPYSVLALVFVIFIIVVTILSDEDIAVTLFGLFGFAAIFFTGIWLGCGHLRNSNLLNHNLFYKVIGQIRMTTNETLVVLEYPAGYQRAFSFTNSTNLSDLTNGVIVKVNSVENQVRLIPIH